MTRRADSTSAGADKPSDALFALAENVLPGAGLGAYSLPENIRMVFSHGEGARIFDVDGNAYIDYVGGAGALLLGHSHPAVVAAAQAQQARGAHSFATLSQPAIELAARLARDIPCAGKIAYATTGSEATAYAMRMARAFTGREKVLKFEGAYHGNHDYALVSTFPPQPLSDADDASGRPDSGGQPSATLSTMLVAPFNDINAVKKIMARHGKEIAAIIAEGVQRIIPADAEFLHGLRKVCDEHGTVFILDEVVTGFRLCHGGAQEWFGARPHLATYGKVIGAGGPLSCIAGAAEIIDCANPKRKGEDGYAYFNGTLHGNPVAAAATIALLDELTASADAKNIFAKLNARTDAFCRECQAVLTRHNLPAICINTGSLWQILFLRAPPRNYADLLAADSAAMRRLDMEWMLRGQNVLPGVRRFVSTAHGETELEESIAALDAACRAFLRK